jgi:type III secretion system YscI/HrpB-like protein
MSISAVKNASLLPSLTENSISHSVKADRDDIEAFTQRLIAGKSSSPEHQIVNQLQSAQKSLLSGLHDTSLVQRLSPENALTAQARLAGSAIGLDMVAKVAGSFSTAVNKLVSMQ